MAAIEEIGAPENSTLLVEEIMGKEGAKKGERKGIEGEADTEKVDK